MCTSAKDRSISFLNENLGYNVIALPRERFDPLMVLGGPLSGLRFLGYLGDLVKTRAPLPPVEVDDPMPDLAGRRSDLQEAKVGLTFLETLLKALGWQGGSLALSFKEAAFIQMVYRDVRHDFVAPMSVLNYLAEAAVNPQTPEIFRQCEAVVLVTDTLKSNCFGVMAYDRDKRALDLDIGALQEVVGVEAGILVSRESEGNLLYRGTRQLRFAFRGLRLVLDEERSRLGLDLEEEMMVARAKAGEEPPAALPLESYVVPVTGQLLEIKFS
ncbi:MAG: hypothetical protein WHT07_02500 [Desulfobaccales bacterium]